MKKLSKFLSVFLVISLLFSGLAKVVEGQEVLNIDKDKVIRLSERDRIETSIKASQEAYKKSESVVLAGYNGEIDALAGTLLATSKKVPLLLTHKNKVD